MFLNGETMTEIIFVDHRIKAWEVNVKGHVPYFFDYKTEFFSLQNNPKTLDPSFKTDLDLWYCLGRVKLVL